MNSPQAGSELLVLGSGASEAMPAGFCVCDFCRRARAAGGGNIRLRAGYQLGETIRVDWGPDAAAQALRFDLPTWRLRRVFLTHSHEDHLFPMDFWTRGVSRLPDLPPLQLHANAECLAAVGRAIGGDWKTCRLEPQLIRPGIPVPLPEEGMEVVPLPAAHTEPEQSMMFLFRSSTGELLMTGDTGPFPSFTRRFLLTCRLTAMVFDATWGMADRVGSHLGIPGALREIEQLRRSGAVDGKTRLIATHFAHGPGARLQEEFTRLLAPLGLEPACDGLRLQWRE